MEPRTWPGWTGQAGRGYIAVILFSALSSAAVAGPARLGPAWASPPSNNINCGIRMAPPAPDSSRIVVPGMADLPVVDGIMDEWEPGPARIPGTWNAHPSGVTGDLFFSWLPEGLAIALKYAVSPSPVPASRNSGADTALLTVGIRLSNDRPVLFTLSGIQKPGRPGDPDSPFIQPSLESVRNGIPFPDFGRMMTGQSRDKSGKTIEVFLPARLFRREFLRPGDTLRGCVSLRMAAANRELSWPSPFNPSTIADFSLWIPLKLGEARGVSARTGNRPPTAATASPESLESLAPSSTVPADSGMTETAGSTGTAGESMARQPAGPGKLALANPVISPNPYSPGRGRKLALETSLNKPAKVTIIVYGKGKKIIRRFPERNAQAGPYLATWNGATETGRPVQAGDYLMGIIATNGKEVASQTIAIRVGKNGR